MTKNDSRARYDWVDTLKFLGILFIYIGHFGESSGKLYNWVFQFHVPLFFFVSGFFFKIKQNTNLFEFSKDKIVKYIFPYFAFTILLLFANTIKYNYSFNDVLLQCKLILFGVRNTLQSGGAWFLPCLFVINLIYYMLNRLTNKKIILFFLSLFLYFISIYVLPDNPAVFPSWIWNIDSALFYILYFCIGNISFNFIEDIKERKINTVVSKLLIISVIFFTIFLFFFERSFLGIFSIGKMYFLSDILITLILILFNCFFAFLLEKVVLLKNIGKETMYLCLNEVFIKNIIIDLLSVLGFTVTLNNPLTTVVYSFLIMYINYKYLIPILKKIYTCIFRKCEVLFNEISFN